MARSSRRSKSTNIVEILDAGSALFHLLHLLDLNTCYAIEPVSGNKDYECLAAVISKRIQDPSFNSTTNGKVSRMELRALLHSAGILKIKKGCEFQIKQDMFQNIMSMYPIQVQMSMDQLMVKGVRTRLFKISISD